MRIQIQPYSYIHITIILFFIGIPFLLSNRHQKITQKRIYYYSILLFLLELIRMLYLIIFHEFSWETSLPIQLCFTIAYILPFSIKYQWNIILCYTKTFSILFGSIAILFHNPEEFEFMLFHSYLYHSLLIYIGCLLYKEKKIYNFHYYLTNLIIFFSQIFIACTFNYFINGNYIFLNTILHPKTLIYQQDPVIITLGSIHIFHHTIYDYLSMICNYISIYGYYFFLVILMIIVHHILFFITNQKNLR